MEDWLWAEPAEYTDVEPGTDLIITCSSVVKPNSVKWYFSSDSGENWTEVEEGTKGLELKIKNISAENNGNYSICDLWV